MAVVPLQKTLKSPSISSFAQLEQRQDLRVLRAELEVAENIIILFRRGRG